MNKYFRGQWWSIDDGGKKQWSLFISWSSFVWAPNMWCIEFSWCLHQNIFIYRLDRQKLLIFFLLINFTNVFRNVLSSSTTIGIECFRKHLHHISLICNASALISM